MRLNDFFYNRLFILNFCLFFRGLLFLTKAQPGKKATFFFFRNLRLHSSLLLHGTALTLCT
ncbi:putative membrane protein [Escherichia coli P0304799.3]|nr:putative membrane protein [Escherichia coli P0304799.3]